MKKLLTLILAVVLMMSIAVAATAEGIIYIITPSTSNPFFKTEQDVGAPKAESLGYEVKCFSHDDDAAAQLQLFEAAINDKAVAIICDNAGADASIEAVRMAKDAGAVVQQVDRSLVPAGSGGEAKKGSLRRS